MKRAHIKEVWFDEHLIEYLRFKTLENLQPWERERVSRRANNYEIKKENCTLLTE